MKRYLFSIILILASMVSGLPGVAHEHEEDDYTGGRGVITLTGPTGMFLNPTSGIASHKGGVTAQACLAALPMIQNTEHTILFYYLLNYTPLEWLDFGFQGIAAQQNSDTHLNGFGTQVRGRVLKDESWWPETSLGFSFFEGGQKPIARRDFYLALSKAFNIHDGSFLNLIRFHAGGRFFSTKVAPDGPVGYGGGEVRVWNGIYIVGEVQTKDGDVDRFMPYAFGIQGRSPGGFAFTLAGVQTGGTGYTAFPGAPGAQGFTGGTKKPAIYVGIGASFF